MTSTIVPSAKSDQTTILNAIREGSDSLIRIESEREQIKAITEALVEKFPDIPKKYFKKLMTVYHKQNFSVFESETEDFVTLYTTVVGK